MHRTTRLGPTLSRRGSNPFLVLYHTWDWIIHQQWFFLVADGQRFRLPFFTTNRKVSSQAIKSLIYKEIETGPGKCLGEENEVFNHLLGSNPFKELLWLRLMSSDRIYSSAQERGSFPCFFAATRKFLMRQLTNCLGLTHLKSYYSNTGPTISFIPLRRRERFGIEPYL